MSIFEVTGADRARWQRKAADRLVAILDAHPELPPITWTVSGAGSMLVGHVNGLAPAGQVRQVFTAWQAALVLPGGQTRSDDGGVTYLQAMAHHDCVCVRLTATVFTEGDHS